MNQIAQAEKLLQKLKEEVSVWETRLTIAKNQAESLESRNKLVLDNIQLQASVKQKSTLERVEAYKKQTDGQISQARKVLKRLLDEVARHNRRKTALEQDIDSSMEAQANLEDRIQRDSAKHQLLLDNLLTATAEIKGNETRINDLRTEIRELNTAKLAREADLEILQEEASIIEGKIIELDAEFESRKRYLDDQLYETHIRLKKVTDSLQIAQNKDKEMRQAWADEQLKLDKRVEAVRRMEARVSGAEARIEELKRYDIL